MEHLAMGTIMRKILLLSVAATMMASPVLAQDSRTVIVEPVTPSFDQLVTAPIEYDENGVVKAQHFSANDLTDEQYQALLREADRIRAYQSANGVGYATSDTIVTPATTVTYEAYESATTYSTPTYSTYEAEAPIYQSYEAEAPSYEIELFAPEAPSASPKFHTVAKGDTLYNLSKRYDTTVPALKSANGLSSTTLSLGQTLTIPGVIVESVNTTAIQPIFASTPTQDGYVTRRIVEPTPASLNASSIYAVLPKDTLYSISRRVCVGVNDLIAVNGIKDPTALQPGQRLNLPSGHCLAN
jgi:LysM repeat protein